MSLKPKVSIIIPVYNGSNYLGEAIESCLRQTYSSYEIIVVNDGSDDNGRSREVTRKYGEKLRYFEKENGGVASALNFGIRRMGGDYFAWLSHDDVFCPNKLEAQMNAIEQTGNPYTIALANYYLADSDLKDRQNTAFQNYYPRYMLENSVFPLFWGEFHFSGLLFHKSHFDRIGYFDEALQTAQDNDFIYRLLRHQKTAFTVEPVSIVRLHGASGTARYRSTVNEENRSLYAEMLSKMDEKELAELTGSSYAVLAKVGGIISSMGEKEQAKRISRRIPKEQLRTASVGSMEKVVLFGAGQYGERLRYELEQYGIKPFAFLDNDKEKNGTLLEGIPCYLPEKVKTLMPCQVIITQKYHIPAVKQLEAMGIKDYMVKEEADALLLRGNTL